jgi:hypothetical protein
MLDKPSDDLLLQSFQATQSIEVVKDWLMPNHLPLSRPITRYFIGDWNENLAKFTPH